ncbi:MAG: TMEM165/GDT1 family protein [Proteobacteria bacterium]|nr:TMEM165/GDT1 family protein [Pseudomonadota bacterium]
MEALISSTIAVTIAEIGDKSQLLSLFLASRFTRRYAIIAGILAATLFNHTVSAWFGVWLLKVIPPGMAPWLISASFLLIALWLLFPDQNEEGSGRFDRFGPFIATTILFFLVEIGDKTQIATIVLAAKYNQTSLVILGTTLGMVIANLPVVLAGGWIMRKIPLNYARWTAFALFLAMGVITIYSAAAG